MAKPIVSCCVVLLVFASMVSAGHVDTDGDGLLDLLDVHEFDPAATEAVGFGGRRIEDLDGANQLTGVTKLFLHANQIHSIDEGDFRGLADLLELELSLNQISSIESGGFDGLANLRTLILNRNQISNIESGHFAGLSSLYRLELSLNQISSIERSDFDGLHNLRAIRLAGNQITSIDMGDFSGLPKLQDLILYGNPISSIESGAFSQSRNLRYLALPNLTTLNLTGAVFESLLGCWPASEFGICTGGATSLILNSALLDLTSFLGIVREVREQSQMTDVSLVNLTFSDESPADMGNLLGIETLNTATIDANLFAMYADEFTAWDAVDGNTLTIVVPGDINHDGSVDASDANALFEQWGTVPDPYDPVDVNDDGMIDAADAGILFAAWTGDGAASVPEPMFGPAALSVLFVAVRRRRA